MARRFHTPRLTPGDVVLDAGQSRHARDVLRLETAAAVELFDDSGRTAAGEVVSVGPPAVVVRVARVVDPPAGGLRVVVASAVPKGNRADWMVEKLAELGVDALVPLAARRSVARPEGAGKLGRWDRLSAEASKQSRRVGVMRVDPLAPVADVLRRLDGRPAWCLSTEPGTIPVAVAVERVRAAGATSLTLLIGPEGGWADDELAAFDAAGVTRVRLTATVLRVETAAVCAAGVAMSMLGSTPGDGA